jgi:small GTP-binding protein
MIQKKVCMVGVYGTGKTSLVQRYVYSIFSAKYHSTVGVKIDRKLVPIGDTTVNLLLWDIEGRSPKQEIPASYLRGTHAVFFVADGTKRETFEQLFDLARLTRSAAGDVPSVVALNKADLRDQWVLKAADTKRLLAGGFHALNTSAKTGDGVEDAFLWLAKATLNASLAPDSQA